MKHIRIENYRSLPILLFAAGLVWLGGCSCKPAKAPAPKAPAQSQTIEEMEALRKKRDAEREEKPDFEIIDLQVMPSDEPAKTTQARPQSHVKAGHWFGAVQRMKANNFDFPKGDLEAECVDEKVKSIKLAGEFELLTTRSVSLPKGQQKNTDLILFAPDTKKNRFFFMSRLRPRGGGRQLEWQSELATKMKASENHFVVLAERADNYQFFKNLRLVNPQCASVQFLEPKVDYRIKLPKGTQRVDLSSHPLTWSTVAYVVWDDFDPEILTIAQQQAMLDWLHWGGQLVVNGPRTLDRLSASFLGEYLPARAEKTTKISDEQFAVLNEHWSFDESLKEPDSIENSGVKRKPITQYITVGEEEDRPISIQLVLSDNSHFVANTGDLIAEKQLGRGSIRVTAFNMPHSVFRQWAGYDSFINACLLGRPARRFFLSGDSGLVTENWAQKTIDREDPRTTSQVRYFSRDATSTSGRMQRPQKPTASNRREARQPIAIVKESETEIGSHNLRHDARETFGIAGFAQDDALGVAGWNDDSDVSRMAAHALRSAAGIDVPPARFVAKVLGIYLIILVPANWLLFRLMGRVEWAWAMIPLISIAGAIGVLRATSLDIGFVRSRTEVAVLELQPGYDRAHVTRYVGFYTSLTSPYEITGDDESSLLLPLSELSDESKKQRVSRNVGLQFGDTVKMTGLSVASNSTGMVHTEQMLNVGGSIELANVAGRTEVQNNTNLDLQGVVVVRRISEQDVEFAQIGQFKAQSKQMPEFQRLATPSIESEYWESSESASRVLVEGGLNIRDMLDMATSPERLGIAETVLVGWTEELIPGISVKPKASQVVARSVVVAQLEHAARPRPIRDANSFVAKQQLAKARQQEADAFDDF